MSMRKTLLKQVLSWCEDQLGITGSGATPQVILAQRGEKSPRPSLPYLILNFTTFDTPVGTTEGKLTEELKSYGLHYQAMLEIKGIGPGSDDWLGELAMHVGSFEGDMTITTSGSGGTLDVSLEVNDSFEEQYIKEFLCEYKVRDSQQYPTADQTTLGFSNVAEDFTLTTVIDWESP
jgi:hypothetical protein